jgi:NDP-sugar pyrophosphorylase family protein
MTLVIMAAGMGSRFGGLKQVEPVGPNEEFILDYSIYDAKKAGFDKVVFIIKEENYDLFRNTVGKRIEGIIKVDYVFQDITKVPEFIKVPEERTKPWGTAHAIFSCKDVVEDKFAVINADDYYGYEAFKVISSYLETVKEDEYCLVGYKVINTLTENGSVKRGYCEVEDGYLTNLIESNISKENDIITASPLDGRESFILNNDDLVSMNLFGFNPNIFKFLSEDFIQFFEENKNNLDNCEWLIPNEVFNIMNKGIKVKVLNTNSKWYGVTYKEDKEIVVNAIQDMIEKGIYKSNLWQK